MYTLHLEGNSVVRVVEAPDPAPGEGEVVIRTAVSALCGSELHNYRGPGVASGNSGHEAAGTVLQVGPGVARLIVGQRVGISAVVGCGHCEYCAKGQYTWCRNRPGYWSMHAERILTAARACHPLPDDISWDVGALISGDGLGVPYHAWTKIQDPAIKTMAVFGVGPIGLGNVLLESTMGRRVIAVDISPERLGLALKLGAVEAVDARSANPVTAIRDLTEGRGADVCLEASGKPEPLKQCFAAVRPGGTVLIVGEQPRIELSPSEDFIRRDIAAIGSFFYHFSEFPQMLALVRQGLPVERLITHHFPFEQADAAYREFAAARTGKVLLVWESVAHASLGA